MRNRPLVAYVMLCCQTMGQENVPGAFAEWRYGPLVLGGDRRLLRGFASQCGMIREGIQFRCVALWVAGAVENQKSTDDSVCCLIHGILSNQSVCGLG